LPGIQVDASQGGGGADTGVVSATITTQWGATGAGWGDAVAEHVGAIDPAVDPLMRGVLWRIAAERHVLLLTWHHLVVDGWSLRLFLDDLSRPVTICDVNHRLLAEAESPLTAARIAGGARG
jgi:hypothetical protein